MDDLVGDDGLTNAERNQCREAFERFDKDNSGAISDWELRAMLQCTATAASNCRLAPPMNGTASHPAVSLAPAFARAALGPDPTDEEIFDMIAAVDEDGSNEIGVLLLAIPCEIGPYCRRAT